MCHRYLTVLSALLIVSAAIPALSQVAPEAQGKSRVLPLRVGVGYSNYGSDWNGRLGGPDVWIDFDVPKMSGLQIEAEGRDLNYNRTWGDPTLRQYTVAGGFNYAWRYDPAFHPYVRFLAGVGNINWHTENPGYRKDSRTFYAPAGGIEVRAYRRLWIRGNYEYQFWPNLFLHHHTLTPRGFTVGAFYDFSKFALVQYKEGPSLTHEAK